MPSASSQGALGAVVALLAIAALAATRPAPQPADAKLARPAPIASAAVRALRDGQTLDINSAHASELLMLPGVGPKLAQRIVEERERRAGFRSVEDLLDVRGIGPAVFERLMRFVSVSVPGTGTAPPQRSNNHDSVSVPVK